jgi:hypothetical protein
MLITIEVQLILTSVNQNFDIICNRKSILKRLTFELSVTWFVACTRFGYNYWWVSVSVTIQTMVNMRNVGTSWRNLFVSNIRLLHKVKKCEHYFFTLVTRSETHQLFAVCSCQCCSLCVNVLLRCLCMDNRNAQLGIQNIGRQVKPYQTLKFCLYRYVMFINV